MSETKMACSDIPDELKAITPRSQDGFYSLERDIEGREGNDPLLGKIGIETLKATDGSLYEAHIPEGSDSRNPARWIKLEAEEANQ